MGRGHPRQEFEACILAGGLSSRMGTDKSALRLGGKSLLTRVRLAAWAADLRVRVVRRDLMPRRGPLGGVYTGLRTARAEAVLFLSCDMPFLTGATLKRAMRSLGPRTSAVFFMDEGQFGFPFVIRTAALGAVEWLLVSGERSLQALAAALHAKRLHPTPKEQPRLLNINTPAEFARVGGRLPVKGKRLTTKARSSRCSL